MGSVRRRVSGILFNHGLKSATAVVNDGAGDSSSDRSAEPFRPHLSDWITHPTMIPTKERVDLSGASSGPRGPEQVHAQRRHQLIRVDDFCTKMTPSDFGISWGVYSNSGPT